MICCENIVDINCSLLAYIYSSGFDYQTITSVFIKKKKKNHVCPAKLLNQTGTYKLLILSLL